MGYFPYQLVSDLFFNINSRTHRILTLDSTFEVVFHSLPFSWLQRCVCGLGTPPKKWAKRNSKNSFWASNCYTPQEVEELGQSTATTVWKMQNQMAFTKQHPVVMVLFCFRQAMWLMNNMKAPRDRKKDHKTWIKTSLILPWNPGRSQANPSRRDGTGRFCWIFVGYFVTWVIEDLSIQTKKPSKSSTSRPT